MAFVQTIKSGFSCFKHECIQIIQENYFLMMILMRIIILQMNMQSLTFSSGAHFFPQIILCLHIAEAVFVCFILLTQKLDNERQRRSYDNSDPPQAIVSASISNFDNSSTDNCLPVHQRNACSKVGNLGHLKEARSTNHLMPLPRSR